MFNTVKIDSTVNQVKIDPTANTVGLDTSANGVKLISEAGASYGVKHISNKPRVSAMPYLYDIAELNVANHWPWSKIGFCPSFTANGVVVVALRGWLESV